MCGLQTVQTLQQQVEKLQADLANVRSLQASAEDENATLKRRLAIMEGEAASTSASVTGDDQ
jgi:uncharacterized protein YlxW (UPF0749 family)